MLITKYLTKYNQWREKKKRENRKREKHFMNVPDKTYHPQAACLFIFSVAAAIRNNENSSTEKKNNLLFAIDAVRIKDKQPRLHAAKAKRKIRLV